MPRCAAAALLLILGGAMLAACSGSDEIWAASYDQSCTAASDCVAVAQGAGECCGQGPCNASGAINKSALPAYDAEQSALDQQACGGRAILCPAACLGESDEAPPVACVSGKCVLR